MSAAPASSNPHATGPGLPPVQPPTAGFVVRLFLTPALIVALLVCVAIGFHYFFDLIAGTPSPEKVLKQLDDANPEVRWRAAADLVQVLLRPNNPLSSDPDFGLKLADRLAKTHANSKDAEKSFAGRVGALSKDDAERERKKLEGERNYILYLSACLGNFVIPVGAPVLQQLAMQETGMEPKALYEQRRWAVLGLMVLGEKCKAFDRLTGVEQGHILTLLDQAVERRDHADWATATRDYLVARQAEKATTMGVDTALAKCAEAPQPDLRKLSAMALNFWSGSDEENQRIENTLVKLSFDKGDGVEEQKQLEGDNPEGTTAVTSKPGRQVCYNATIALARRGGAKTRLDVLEEMLDEQQLRDILRIQLKDGQIKPDEGAIANVQITALKALAELSRRNPKLVNEALRGAAKKLTSDKNPDIAEEAKKTQRALDSIP